MVDRDDIANQTPLVQPETIARPTLHARRISHDSPNATLAVATSQSGLKNALSLGPLTGPELPVNNQTLPSGLRSVPAQESSAENVKTPLPGSSPWGGHIASDVGAGRKSGVPTGLDVRRSESTSTPSVAIAASPLKKLESTYDPAAAFPSAVTSLSPRRERHQTQHSRNHPNQVDGNIDAISAGLYGLRIAQSPHSPTWAPPTVPRHPYSAIPDQTYLGYYGHQNQPDLVAAAAAATPNGNGPYFDAYNWQPNVHSASPTLFAQNQNLRRVQTAWQMNGMPGVVGIDRPATRNQVQQYSSAMPRGNYFAGPELYTPGIDYGRPLSSGLVSAFAYNAPVPSVLPGQQVASQRIYRSPLLEEFRTNRHRQWELEEIRSYMCEFANDQLGSRHIQTKLDTASPEERALVFGEILPNLLALCTDTFGNYVCQKLFEVGDREQKAQLVDAFRGNVLRLSLQSYACRVVQKAIEQVNLEQQVQLVNELDGHVLKCARDQNANHTLQKIISCIPSEKIGFIADACLGQVFALATHPYGCRVLQRILENMRNIQPLIDELIKYAQNLIQDQYGNYLAQHLLEHGPPAARSAVISKVRGQVTHLSRHKFASNVIDKAILCSTEEERHFLTEEVLIDPSAVGIMLRDPFANYPLQKFLLTVQGPQRDVLLARTAEALANLKRYSATYSKHLMAIEKWVLNNPINIPSTVHTC